ncbi:oligodendrocyte-myelin glycoprotein-like isoform X2 [Notolabrus celidotus]|uniref:oligodendrocyte-myelin glycoprotein-like isoform X2 n=1 Tax=Notolabrus celidotus TaxID=1203425 RepID=UPI00148FDD91|nr:oligodendrocyte-myelin glycoprotein-like isoform X2 [Notolabrus celidotus]
MRRHVLLKLPPHEALLELLLVLSLGLQVLAVCPSMCTCSHSHREVDCSWRGLRQLPVSLQHNIHSLNLSHNRFHNLDGQLSTYTHLRFLDLSHNRLSHLPTGLPRSLWNLYASFNRLQLLDKNDTVYQWNLRMLDLSYNKLERAIFINNTLINLCMLNLSHNHFRTLPTNLPAQLETIDLSHNLLVKVLAGSLDRLIRLTHFYLHANSFASLPYGLFDKLVSLKVITLGDNPWDCHLYADVAYLLSWSQRTPVHILGCPCHTQPVCGELRPSRTGGWHFASYNLPPLAASAQDQGSMPPEEASVTDWWYLSVSSMLSTPNTSEEILNTQHNNFRTTPISPLAPRSTGKHRTINHLSVAEHMLHPDSHLVSGTTADSLHTTDISSVSDTSFITSTPNRADTTPATGRYITTESSTTQTKRTTTLRTRSVRRQNPSSPRGISNSSPAHATCSLHTLLHNLVLLFLILQPVL